ncbi:hypothetical protein LCGC14_2916380, partial [marine sediment metagenome]
MQTIFKIWGKRTRLFENETCELDKLELIEDSFCSIHSHQNKINTFHVIFGRVMIETEYGDVVLATGESFIVRPPLLHRFKALD